MSGRSRDQGLGQDPAPQYGLHDGPGGTLVASASGTSTSTSTSTVAVAAAASGSSATHRPTSSTYGSFPSSSRLLSASTFSFIASWRGQLLVCFIAVILSLLFFLIQRPYKAWRTSRQEARSRSMTAELLRGEEKPGQESKKDAHAMVHADDKGPGGKAQAKEKKHQAKKRKGSLLHAPTTGSASATVSATTSSIETSPAPNTKGLSPVASAPNSTPAKAGQRATSTISTAVSTPATSGPGLHPRRVSATSPSDSPTPRIHLREPSTDAADSHLVPPPATRPVAPSHPPDPDTPAWSIPLPVSPLAPTSGLDYASDVSHDAEADVEAEGEAEGEGDGEGEDEAGSSAAERPVKSEGWSIWPEEGYLPAPQPLHGKKKKKRAKHASVMSPSNPLATSITSPQAVAGPSQSQHQPESAGPSAPTGPSVHPVASPSPLPRSEHASASAGSAASAASGSDGTPGKHRHSRKASLGRPRNMELQELLDLRESMLDALRADVGMARAEQAKAKDDADRARASEDRARAELDRLRKSINRADVDSRRREGDLQNNFNQLQLTYNAMVHRLTTLETMMRDSGMAFPPASPGIPNMPGAHTPHRLSLGHSSLSVPASPFQMGFASPVPGHGSPMMPYSPGMMQPGTYPAHFLHPNYPSHLSPSPQRRLSAHELSLASGEILAGPLTPGHLGAHSPGHSPYPPEIAQSHVASPAPEGLPSGMSPEEYRRVSIESSVLKKKKTPPPPGSEDDSAGVPVASGSGSGAEAINEEADEAESSVAGSDNPAGGVQGLGVGEIDAVPSAFTGPVTDPSSREGSSTSSHPTSPSQRPAPVTPAGSDLYRTLSAGAESTKHGGAVDYPATPGERDEQGCAGGSSLEPSRPASADGMSRIRVMSDGEGGNVYYREAEASGASASASASGSGAGNNELEMTPHGKASGLQVPSTLDVFTGRHQASSNSSWADLDDEDDDDEDDGIDHEPTFASLAHTEEQKREIARRERIVRRHSAQRARSASAGGVGSGSGSGSGAGRGM